MLQGRAAWLVVSVFLTGCASCDPYAQIARDAKRYPAISASRPLGSPCGPNDSASIRRAAMHPLGPTGMWTRVAEVDLSRTVERVEPPPGSSVAAALMPVGSVFSGYILAPAEGSLHARTYDDVYGEVYGGWSPVDVSLSPTPLPVFVSLGRSAYGDGGLNQVHEVCWIPKGAAMGVLVFSTAHLPATPPFPMRQLYRRNDLGNRASFNSRLVSQLVVEFLREGDAAQARALLADAEVLLTALPGAIDGSTGAAIPSKVFHAREWVEVLVVQLGLAVGSDAFEPIAARLETVIGGPTAGRFCTGCEHHQKLLPLYRWVHSVARGEKAPVPDPAQLATGSVGSDPPEIARFLRGELPLKKVRHLEPNAAFWSGMKALAADDRSTARASLESWLTANRVLLSGFEGASAVAVLAPLHHEPVK
ncbi:MAG: hypothetical protein JNG84_05680 [Archangium sp.]|nr:hypothetical protein [Archangium sp.]